ncbi:hypothetical protein [Luteibacter sp. CQ10]
MNHVLGLQLLQQDTEAGAITDVTNPSACSLTSCCFGNVDAFNE